MVNQRAFPLCIPDVMVYEEASQININDFIRSIVRDNIMGKKIGMVNQIIILGDTQQLFSDIRASYN